MPTTRKLISWNVNGIRSCLQKGFLDFVNAQDPDVLCLQEIKADEQAMAGLTFPFDHRVTYSAEKKGYSGTAVFSKVKPQTSSLGMKDEQYNREGRVITCEFDDFFLVNVYTPNSKDGLLRLPYREHEWDPAFREHLIALDAIKPVIACGDFNVAHEEIDIARPESNHRSAGFTDEERASFGKLLNSGFVDTFRHFFPNKRDAYTWWSFRAGARQRNVGWRIDYFIASDRLKSRLQSASILPEVMGSDHCPVVLEIEVGK
jgi:exodeoxyribonuclease III